MIHGISEIRGTCTPVQIVASGEVIERGILLPRRTSISPAMTEAALRQLTDIIREHRLNRSIVTAVYDPDIEASFNKYGLIEGADG